jgi:hypothetical protein
VTDLFAASARPHTLDGPVPDVMIDLDADFVVEWQVVDQERREAPPIDAQLFEIFLP